ncbi:2,3-diaminopropionate biosynthesis protein SbnA [Actinosynnema sp. NPDC020468]|uniref:2,3-diaminopropionate biosynthesis protein SbnA n=1 Tax=Actinosynnema sp. NPDC020468 TaxID=3154488 RepID=UPI0033E2B967
MPVISAPQEFNVDDLYVDLSGVLGGTLFLKCEGLNLAGSVKLKAAAAMIGAVEELGLVGPDTTIVESSSGNLGVALSMIAANRGHRFVCVTDIRCNPAAVRLMRAFGARVDVVDTEAGDRGYLGARLDHVRAMCAADDNCLWLNQYANPDNWRAHYRTTGPEILRRFPEVDVLFVGAGTTGTLMGCARYFHDQGHPATVVAVDAAGSVTFGDTPGRRLIPGLGAGVRPEILEPSYVDEVVHVAEPDAIRVCRDLAARGFLFGGSTGTVLAGAAGWLAANGARTAVAVSPDLGERYLDSIYDDDWLAANYGPEVLAAPNGRAGHR